MNRWTCDEIRILKEFYSDYGAEKVSADTGRSINSVIIKANRMGLQRSNRHWYDTDYFTNVDSPDKSYWIGFLIADGYVTSCPEQRNFELGIELSKCDSEHLRKFLDSVHSDAEVHFRKRKNFASKNIDKEYEGCFVRIYSRKIVESLAQYGIVQNKTYSLKRIEGIPKEFIWDYIRGYFDGDGSLSSSTVKKHGIVYKYPKISFVCKNKEFLEDIQLYLKEEGISSNIYKDKSCWTMFIRQKDSVCKFLNLIYKDNHIRLDRKYEKYKTLLLN